MTVSSNPNISSSSASSNAHINASNKNISRGVKSNSKLGQGDGQNDLSSLSMNGSMSGSPDAALFAMLMNANAESSNDSALGGGKFSSANILNANNIAKNGKSVSAKDSMGVLDKKMIDPAQLGTTGKPVMPKYGGQDDQLVKLLTDFKTAIRNDNNLDPELNVKMGKLSQASMKKNTLNPDYSSSEDILQQMLNKKGSTSNQSVASKFYNTGHHQQTAKLLQDSGELNNSELKFLKTKDRDVSKNLYDLLHSSMDKVSPGSEKDLANIQQKNNLLMQNIAQKIVEAQQQMASTGKNSTVNVQIEHQELGTIKLQITKKNNGHDLDVQLSTDKHNAYLLINEHKDQLIQALSQKGIFVAELSIENLSTKVHDLSKSDNFSKDFKQGNYSNSANSFLNPSELQDSAGNGSHSEGAARRQELWDILKTQREVA